MLHWKGLARLRPIYGIHPSARGWRPALGCKTLNELRKLHEGVGGSCGRLTLLNTATSQGLLDCTHPPLAARGGGGGAGGLPRSVPRQNAPLQIPGLPLTCRSPCLRPFPPVCGSCQGPSGRSWVCPDGHERCSPKRAAGVGRAPPPGR